MSVRVRYRGGDVANIDMRRVRDAFVKAKVTDAAVGLELATSLEEELSESVVSKERLATLEDRIDARFAQSEASIDARFAQSEASAERRANRHTMTFLAALALAVGVIALLMVVI